MNVADSAKLEAVLESAGYQGIRKSGSGDQESGYQDADIILVNTCVVRQNAEDRAAWFIQSLKGQKKVNPNLRIGLCGCLATEPGRDLKKQFPHVDFFIPPNGADVLAKHLSRVTSHESRVKNGPATRDPRPATAFVNIAHGCDNFCSYCVVPYVRGRETSRPMGEVLEEIKGLAGKGVGGITLLGQNVNSYKFGLASLLREIQQFVIRNSSFVIKFMTSHPRDMSGDIIQAVAELPYVAKEFHLPLQAGDDEILKKMNRGYTVEYYRGLVGRIRAVLPQAQISTDVMVGFPGETEEQFKNLLNVVRELKFSMVNMFAYSPRPETAAAKMPDQVPEEIKQARLQKLIAAVRRELAAA
jgi:tRNA-2-methylthio-N6-dimethylallyladenosine synthase